MDSPDILFLILKCALIVLFVGYYFVGWMLSIRLAPSPVRSLILRWAFVPLVVVAAIAAGRWYCECARGREVVGALCTTLALSFIGALLLSVWLRHGGGREMLFVPIAFCRHGMDEPLAVARAVTDLRDRPDFKRDFILSLLPMIFIIMALVLLMWDTSRPLTS